VNPELEELLLAMEVRDNAPPDKFAVANAEFERVLAPIVGRLSPIGREDFLRALGNRYRAFLKAKQGPPTLPP